MFFLVANVTVASSELVLCKSQVRTATRTAQKLHLYLTQCFWASYCSYDTLLTLHLLLSPLLASFPFAVRSFRPSYCLHRSKAHPRYPRAPATLPPYDVSSPRIGSRVRRSDWVEWLVKSSTQISSSFAILRATAFLQPANTSKHIRRKDVGRRPETKH